MFHPNVISNNKLFQLVQQLYEICEYSIFKSDYEMFDFETQKSPRKMTTLCHILQIQSTQQTDTNTKSECGIRPEFISIRFFICWIISFLMTLRRYFSYPIDCDNERICIFHSLFLYSFFLRIVNLSKAVNIRLSSECVKYVNGGGGRAQNRSFPYHIYNSFHHIPHHRIVL